MGVAEELKAMADRRELDAVEPSVEKAKVMLSAADRSLKLGRLHAQHAAQFRVDE